MNEIQKKLPNTARGFGIVAYYLFLLWMASTVPILHAVLVDRALESTRDPILLPIPFLWLKQLSELGGPLAAAVALCGFWLYFHPKQVLGITVALTVALLLFTTVYGCYAAILLSSELNHSMFTARFFKPAP